MIRDVFSGRELIAGSVPRKEFHFLVVGLFTSSKLLQKQSEALGSPLQVRSSPLTDILAKEKSANSAAGVQDRAARGGLG
jgi:hypothetical protein